MRFRLPARGWGRFRLGSLLVAAAVGSSLSTRTLLSASPAAADASISTSVPTSYSAITDQTIRPKPTTPAPTVGSVATDVTFGSRILRVTDGNTRPDIPNRSYRSAGGTHQNVWNTTSKYFYVISTDGT